MAAFTYAIAQIEQLGAANLTMAQHFDAADAGAVVGEGPLYADTVGYPADGEGLANAAALNLNNDAFEVLKPLRGLL